MTPLIPFTARKYSNMVATIGFFDGVHLGHRCLIEQVINEARQCDMGAFIVTFSNHPRTVVKSGCLRYITVHSGTCRTHCKTIYGADIIS